MFAITIEIKLCVSFSALIGTMFHLGVYFLVIVEKPDCGLIWPAIMNPLGRVDSGKM